MPATASGTIFPATLRHRIIAAAAGDATYDYVIGRAPYAGTVLSVTFIPDTVLTGANTNSETLGCVNKGGAGAGTTSVASRAMVLGQNIAATVPGDITLTATAADREVASGDVLVFRRTLVGTGLANPAGVVEIKIAANS